MPDFQGISEFLNAGRATVDLLKSAAGLIPKGEDRDEAERRIREAEYALKESDAKLAKELGMRLCDCANPPNVMLWREKEQAHVCPNPECGRRINKPGPKRLTRA